MIILSGINTLLDLYGIFLISTALFKPSNKVLLVDTTKIPGCLHCRRFSPVTDNKIMIPDFMLPGLKLFFCPIRCHLFFISMQNINLVLKYCSWVMTSILLLVLGYSVEHEIFSGDDVHKCGLLCSRELIQFVVLMWAHIYYISVNRQNQTKVKYSCRHSLYPFSLVFHHNATWNVVKVDLGNGLLPHGTGANVRSYITCII